MNTILSRTAFGAAIILTCILILPVGVLPAEKQVVGWVENVSVFPGNFEITAKLDTGAENSSLHADPIYVFKRKGQNWVRFDLADAQGRKENFETKVIRDTNIKRKNSDSQKRPVIRLEVCLGTVCKEVEINLVNRSNFDYKMLIGRSFLQGSFIVDSEQMFTVKQKCRGSNNQ